MNVQESSVLTVGPDHLVCGRRLCSTDRCPSTFGNRDSDPRNFGGKEDRRCRRESHDRAELRLCHEDDRRNFREADRTRFRVRAGASSGVPDLRRPIHPRDVVEIGPRPNRNRVRSIHRDRGTPHRDPTAAAEAAAGEGTFPSRPGPSSAAPSRGR